MPRAPVLPGPQAPVLRPVHHSSFSELVPGRLPTRGESARLPFCRKAYNLYHSSMRKAIVKEIGQESGNESSVPCSSCASTARKRRRRACGYSGRSSSGGARGFSLRPRRRVTSVRQQQQQEKWEKEQEEEPLALRNNDDRRRNMKLMALSPAGRSARAQKETVGETR